MPGRSASNNVRGKSPTVSTRSSRRPSRNVNAQSDVVSDTNRITLTFEQSLEVLARSSREDLSTHHDDINRLNAAADVASRICFRENDQHETFQTKVADCDGAIVGPLSHVKSFLALNNFVAVGALLKLLAVVAFKHSKVSEIVASDSEFIPSIVMLFNHQNNKAKQIHGAAWQLLAHVSESSPSVHKPIVQSGICDIAATVLTSPAVKSRVRREVLNLLCTLSDNPHIRKCEELNIIKPILIQEMGKATVSGGAISAALAVANLIGNDKLCSDDSQLRVRDGLVRKLVKAFQSAMKGAKDIGTETYWDLCHLTRGIGNLALHDTNKELLAKAGMVELLLEGLSQATTQRDEGLQCEITAVIWTMAFNERSAKILCRDENLQVLGDVRANGLSAAIRKNVAGALFVLEQGLREHDASGKNTIPANQPIRRRSLPASMKSSMCESNLSEPIDTTKLKPKPVQMKKKRKMKSKPDVSTNSTITNNTSQPQDRSQSEEGEPSSLIAITPVTPLDRSMNVEDFDKESDSGSETWNVPRNTKLQRSKSSSSSVLRRAGSGTSSPVQLTRSESQGNSSVSTKHIMLSYSWANQPEVLKLRDALNKKGYRTWMDVDHMSGSTLEAMARAVENSSLVIMCVSEAYHESQACRTEAEYVYKRRVPFIPCKITDYDPDGWLGILLGTRLWIGFFNQSIEYAVAAVAKEVMNKGIFPEYIGTKGNHSDTVVTTTQREVDTIETEVITTLPSGEGMEDSTEPSSVWVKQWLAKAGLVQYASVFSSNNMEKEQLKVMNFLDDALVMGMLKEDLGIQKLGDRLMMWRLIKELKDEV